MAEKKFKKGDKVDYRGSIQNAEIVNLLPNSRVEIKSQNGTRFVVDASELTKR
jgi:hypothetical protein